MRYPIKRAAPLALVLVLALVLSACGNGDDDVAATADTQPETTETEAQTEATQTEATESEQADAHGDEESVDPFVALYEAAQHVGPQGSSKALAVGVSKAAGLPGDPESGAAELYTSLSSLLQEHVYLAGITIDMGLMTGFDSPTFQAAADTLDRNSVALADLVGSVAPDQRDAFLELWRQHIGFFVDYAQGNKEEALANLDQYRSQAGAFFEQITGGALPAAAVEQELQGHVQTVTAAIDAAMAGDTSVFDKLKMASDHVDAGGASKALANGIAQAANIEGDLDATAVVVRAELANLLQEHVYLAGITVKTAYTAGLDSEAFQAAAGTLDKNSVALADLIGQVAPDQRDAFLELWRQHIGFFVDYAKGAATGDEQAKQQAVSNLDQYRAQAGAFFEQVTGGEIPSSAVEQELKGHIETLTRAIDGLAQALVEQQ